MSAVTKRKYVYKSVLEDFSIPREDQQIVQVLGNRGSNLHQVKSAEGNTILCSLPVKFRKTTWIKRGDFVVIEPIKEGKKVRAEIVRILYPQHVKSLHETGNWPAEFTVKYLKYTGNEQSEKLKKSTTRTSNENDEYYSSDEDDMADIPPNTNFGLASYEDDSSTSTSESECDD